MSTSETYTWFITGTSRGLGLQFVRQLAEDSTNVVIATCRNPNSAPELQKVKENAKAKVYIVALDVADEESIKAAAKEAAVIIGGAGLDYLLNNAGVNPGDDSPFDLKIGDLMFALQSNLVGPILVTQSLLPLIEKGKRKIIMNMTSGLASMGLDIGPKCASYSISKTALNMLTYKQSRARDDVISFVVDPGWVKTDMGGKGAYLEPEESITPFIAFLKRANKDHSGGFFSFKGETKPW